MLDDKLYLPESFDGETAVQVTEELLKHRGQSVVLNSKRVKTAGALGIQVLISARKQWQQDKQIFHVSKASAALLQTVHALGVNCEDVGVMPAQVAS